MSKKEILEFKKLLDSKKEALSNNKEMSQRLLINAGIFTEKGNLKANYRGLCIPRSQA
jgi:hypothetical protein